MVPYYKERVLKDGIRVILRPLVKEDGDKLLDFFHRIDDVVQVDPEIPHT